jgi:WD40 repeat protein
LLLSRNGNVLAWMDGAEFRRLCLWNAQNGKFLSCFNVPDTRSYGGGEVRAETQSLALFGDDFLLGHKGVYIGSAGGETQRFNPLVPVEWMAISPEQRQLATAEGGTISIWELWDGRAGLDARLARQFKTRQDAYSPSCPIGWIDESVLMVCHEGGDPSLPDRSSRSSRLELWDVTTGKLLGELGGIYSPVVSFFRSTEHDGCLFTSHADGAIFAWDFVSISVWCDQRKQIVAPDGPPKPEAPPAH